MYPHIEIWTLCNDIYTESCSPGFIYPICRIDRTPSRDVEMVGKGKTGWEFRSELPTKIPQFTTKIL